ncbi:hypothetical protein FRC01_006637, partial [Tulasnella sp. 417]
MASKVASQAMVNSGIQSLLRAIDSDNALPLECNLEGLSQMGKQDELSACILEAVDLLKQRLGNRTAATLRYHNSLLPSRRLPPEILATIISHSMDDIQSHNYLQRLIKLSTVSSWWRSVTLAHSFLWGVIHSGTPEWIISLALERSK